MSEIFKQRQWTDAELKAAGFRYFPRRKQLIMAARLPASKAPLKIVYELETRYAEAGDVICFDPGTRTRRSIYDYDHWSVKPDIFLETYRKWDVSGWEPNPPQGHLMSYGCRPYYKCVGVWAKRLLKPTRVQSLESPVPMRVEAGAWLAIGTQGEPWHIDDKTFHERYVLPEPSQRG